MASATERTPDTERGDRRPAQPPPEDGAETEAIRDALEEWEQGALAPVLERFPEREQEFRSSSAETQRVYTPLDTAGLDYLRDLGFPGQYPFTRGVQTTMYRGRLWTMRQYAGFGTPEESNQRFRLLIDSGQTGLSVAFDLPTQTGYDSDHPMASGEVGQVGVAIDSLADMETMFEGIALDQISTSMTINAPAAILVAMYIVVAEKQGHSPDVITGTAQNDVLKEYVARGTYIFPPAESVRLAADLMLYCAEHTPRFNSISVSGYHVREAGSTAAQEIAFAFVNAFAYLDACIARGADIDDVAPRLSWIFNTHNSFFEEVAKYRALRRMWATLTRDRYGAKNPQSWMLRTHTQTGGSTLTTQQPLNNIARAAIQALAATAGGVQSLAISCYDEGLAIPSEEAQQTALRTQQIIAHETGVADTVDPLAGSYYVEALTSHLEQEARAIMERVEDLGGAVAAVESGYVQSEVQEAAVAYQHEIESGERVIVGVNRYVDEEEQATATFHSNPAVAEHQIERLRSARAGRDQAAVEAALKRLRDASGQRDNLIPAILDAVRSYATLGEMCGVLRDEWGVYTAPTAV